MDTNLDAPDAQLPRGGPNRISPTLRQVNAQSRSPFVESGQARPGIPGLDDTRLHMARAARG